MALTSASANPRRVTARNTRVTKPTAVVRAPLKYVEVLDTQAADDAALTRWGLAVLRVEGLQSVRLGAEVHLEAGANFRPGRSENRDRHLFLVCS